MTPEQQQRIAEIEERQQWRSNAQRQNGRTPESNQEFADVDFLLSLVKSQEAPGRSAQEIAADIVREWSEHDMNEHYGSDYLADEFGAGHLEERIATAITNATASMRSACVEKVRACAAIYAENDSEAGRWMSVAAADIITVDDEALRRLICPVVDEHCKDVQLPRGINGLEADLVKAIRAPASTVAPQQSDELAEVTRERDALRAENKRVYTPSIVEGLKLLEDAGFGKETPNSLSCMIQKALAQLERYRQENGELRAQLSGTKNL